MMQTEKDILQIKKPATTQVKLSQIAPQTISDDVNLCA